VSEQDGKLFVFDATHEHSAWNSSNRDRYILYLDMKYDWTSKPYEL